MNREKKKYYNLDKHFTSWSTKDIRLLRKLYPDAITKDLVGKFGRTIVAINAKASKLEIKKNWRKHYDNTKPTLKWSKKETKLLEKLYPITPNSQLEPYFPKRSLGAVLGKAILLGLKKKYINRLKEEISSHEFNPWTKKDDELLKKLYPYMPNKEMVKKFGRTKSAISRRAQNMNLYKKDYTPALRKTDTEYWSKKQIALLKKEYPAAQTKDLAKKIGRTEKSVLRKAECLGIKKDPEKFIRHGKPKKYSDKEIKKICELWESWHTKSQIAEITGKSYNVINYILFGQQQKNESIRKEMPDFWSKEEDDYLIKNYKKISKEEISNALKRTESAVHNRVNALCIADKGAPRWTKKDLMILEKYYGVWTAREISEKLGKSIPAVRKKAFKLGLTKKI